MILSAQHAILRSNIFYILLITTYILVLPHAYAESVNPKTHKRLASISKLLSKNNHEKALIRLEPLLKYTKNDTYESALINQLAGYVYLQSGQHENSIRYFKKCIDSNKLPSQINHDIRLILTQLYLTNSQHKKAESFFEEWISNAKTIKPNDYALGGSIYVATHNYSKAQENLEKATNNPDDAKETWLKMLLFIYYETKQYRKAEKILEQLVAKNHSNTDYWRRLSDIKYELDDVSGSLITLQIAHQGGLLDQEEDIIRLANLYILNFLPQRAATIIDKSLKTGKLKASNTVTVILFNAYTAAQDISAASNSLESFGNTKTHSELYLRGAYLHIENENWPKAELLLERLVALENPPGSAYLALGITKTNQNNYDKAQKWFNKAMEDEKSRNTASGWVQFIESRKKVFP